MVIKRLFIDFINMPVTYQRVISVNYNRNSTVICVWDVPPLGFEHKCGTNSKRFKLRWKAFLTIFSVFIKEKYM